MAKRDDLTTDLSSPASPSVFVNMKDSTVDKRSPVTALVITVIKQNIAYLRDLCREINVALLSTNSTVASHTGTLATHSTKIALAETYFTTLFSTRNTKTVPLAGVFSSHDDAQKYYVGKIVVTKCTNATPGSEAFSAYEIIYV